MRTPPHQNMELSRVMVVSPDLVVFAAARVEGPAQEELRHHAAQRPHVDGLAEGQAWAEKSNQLTNFSVSTRYNCIEGQHLCHAEPVLRIQIQPDTVDPESESGSRSKKEEKKKLKKKLHWTSKTY